MVFAERAAARKRAKDLKNELKELKKAMLSAGGDKAQVTGDLKEFGEALERGETLHRDYEEAAAHLARAREAIKKLLVCMSESPAAEVKGSLEALVVDLEQVYHDCSIRADDLDFQSTVHNLKQMAGSYCGRAGAAGNASGTMAGAAGNTSGTMVGATGNASGNAAGMVGIMLRSELENVEAVLSDASEWRAPDFLALGYFLAHEDGGVLGEMENEQRNAHVLSYAKAQFLDAFIGRCQQTGVEETVRALIQSYIYA